MKRCGAWGAWLLACVFAVGCSGSGATGEHGKATGTETNLTQIHASLDLAGLAGDVAAIQYDITCEDGTSVTQVVPLEEELSPGFVTGGTHAFADLFQVLPANAGLCTITATPLQADGTPSEQCEPATTTVTVVENMTTEVVLAMQCEGTGSTGAIDVVGTLNRPPVITHLDIDPSKFILACQTGTVAVFAEDPEGDPLTYAFTVINTPAGAVYTFSSLGNEFSMEAETPGTYTIQVVVTDSHGASTTFTFPIHVQNNPDCEHLGEGCCQMPDGTIIFGQLQACIEAGGQEVSDDTCKQDTCCKTGAGYVVVDLSDCPATAIVPMADCQKKVCCQRGDAAGGLTFDIVPQSECVQPGIIAPNNMCKEICCKNPVTGFYQTTTAGFCKANGGIAAAPALCTFVCCRDNQGNTNVVPPSECQGEGFSVVPNENCHDQVCCVVQGATPQFMSEIECALAGGASGGPELCGPVVIPVDPPTFEADPCDPEKLIVVPDTAANKLAIFSTQEPAFALQPGSPFDTCPGGPSRVIFDWNNDVIATCRFNDTIYKHKKDGTVLWTTVLPGCTGGSRGVVVVPDGRLFVGCSWPATVYNLDHATGAILSSLPLGASTHIYGFTADAGGLYVADYSYATVHKIDVATNTVAWTVTGPEKRPYGIAADGLGHVWAGGPDTLKKFNAADGTLLNAYPFPPIAGGQGGLFCHGVAVDLLGFVYCAMGSSPNALLKFDPVAETWQTLTLPGTELYSKGVTVDAANNVYSINLVSHSVTKFDSTTATIGTFGGTVLTQPYAYGGDMTGLNLCLSGLTDEWISPPIGACGATSTWGIIQWAATTPPGSSVNVYVSADGGTTWQLVTNGQNLGISANPLLIKTISTSATAASVPTITSITVECIP